MNPARLKIRTPEGITFSFALAGPIPRCLAWMVDLVITALIVGVSLWLVLILSLASADHAQMVLILLIFVVPIAYGILTEWLWRGQTVGKRMFRLRVMDAEGLRLQPHQVVMRNLLRAADMLPTFYLVGGLACLLTRKAQRLGDLAAGTVVVHTPRNFEPDLEQLLGNKYNSLREHPHLAARLRQRVSPEEARLVLQALVRRDEFEPAERVLLFQKLSEHFKAMVQFPPEVLELMPDEQFIRNVVDILFRTKAAPVSKPAMQDQSDAQEPVLAG